MLTAKIELGCETCGVLNDMDVIRPWKRIGIGDVRWRRGRLAVAIGPENRVAAPEHDVVSVRTVDRTVLLLTLIVASLTALITGIIPAFRVSSANPGDVMKIEARSSTASRGRQHLVAVLVASEVAVTFIDVMEEQPRNRTGWARKLTPMLASPFVSKQIL